MSPPPHRDALVKSHHDQISPGTSQYASLIQLLLELPMKSLHSLGIDRRSKSEPHLRHELLLIFKGKRVADEA